MLPVGDVTFLFTDIEGSTRLFQKDHKAMDEALVRHHKILHESIWANDGHVFQIVGDAFCAAFADPVDAIRAAADGQRALHQATWPGIGDLRVRMGVHTGNVELRRETYPSSLTLVSVQRVMAAGHGEQTLIAESTAELVRDSLPDGVVLRDLGEHRLRGLSELTRLFQLVVPELPSEFPALKTVEPDPGNPTSMLELLRSGIMVGRAGELEELQRHVGLAMESRGHLVLLSGEPGVGKTHLARSVMEMARCAGAVVLTGGCYEYEAATAYLPFVEAIRDWVHWHSGDKLRDALDSTVAELVRLAPEIESKLGPIQPNAALPAADERLRLFDNVARFFDNLARPGGLVIFLDDLHWADESTLSLLHYLLRHLRSSRVLFIGAYREVELDRRHPLSGALVEWNQQQLTKRISLSRLSREDTAELVLSLFGQQAVSSDFIDLLYSETAGNPFFVEETVKTLIEQGSLYWQGDSWEHHAINELIVPQSVKDAVGRRLNRIDETTISVLHNAAALGKQFDFTDLAAVTSQSEDQLLDAVDEASAAQLIAVTQGDSYAFTHDVIREVLYEELNPIRRRRLHQRIGETLIRLHGESDDRVDDIAYHFAQSGDLERSLHFSRRAAQVSAGVNAFQEAQRLLEQAREAADALGNAHLVSEILEEKGDLAFTEGRTKDAARYFEEALDGPGEARSGILQSKIGRSYCQTGNEQGIGFIQRALKSLSAEKHPVERSLALAALGRYYHYHALPREAIEQLEEALVLAEKTGDTNAIGMIYSFLSGAYQHLRDHVTSNMWAQKLVELGENRDHPHSVASGSEFLSENGFMVGRFQEAIQFAETDRRIGREIGALDRVAWGSFALSQALHGYGDLRGAWRAAKDGFTLGERIGEERLLAWIDPGLALIAADLGDHEAAARHAEAGLTRSGDLGQLVLCVWAWNAAGYHLLRTHRYDDALREFGQCLSSLTGAEVVAPRSFFVGHMVETLILAGHLDRAAAMLAEERGLIEKAPANGVPGALDRLEARLEAKRGDHAVALDLISRAITEEENHGIRLSCARDLLFRGELLQEAGNLAGAAADRSRGEVLLHEFGAGSGIPGDAPDAAGGA